MRWFLVILLATAGCRTPDGASSLKDAGDEGTQTYVSPVTLFMTPSPQGHQPVIDAINGAAQSVHMTMFHLDDGKVTDALIAAQGRGLEVKVIVDRAGLSDPKLKATFDQMTTGGVAVRASSAAFPITHEKALVLDGATALIMSLNMTNAFKTTRDFGLVVTDPGVVGDVSAVFDTDWSNAASGAGASPALQSAATVLSPVNSEVQLTALINSATSSLILTVENLDAAGIVSALADAAGRGVSVQVMVPMCDQNPNPLLNYPSLSKLAAAGAQVRVMPYPPAAAKPYMHAKMIAVDGARAYVGSVNYSTQSLTKARELGVLSNDVAAIGQIAGVFATDWAKAVAPPNPLPSQCPAS